MEPGMHFLLQMSKNARKVKKYISQNYQEWENPFIIIIITTKVRKNCT